LTPGKYKLESKMDQKKDRIVGMGEVGGRPEREGCSDLTPCRVVAKEKPRKADATELNLKVCTSPKGERGQNGKAQSEGKMWVGRGSTRNGL